MTLQGFDELHCSADDRREPVPISVAGADDPTVLQALRTAVDRGWVAPVLVGPEAEIRAEADRIGVALDGFRLLDAPADSIAPAAVTEVAQKRARMLMKGQIPTPELLRAVLAHEAGLRTDQVVCQVVLMEIPRDARRFLLADTGITVRPTPEQKAGIIVGAASVARALGEPRPRVAVMAATETVKSSMPETLDAAYLQTRCQAGEINGCVVQGPLSFDLAYAADAADRKRIAGEVVGAADAMVFPDLLSANLTVKAIMYTADCRFGGVLRGTSAPVAFMSRADSVETRLNSLALALRVLARSDDA